MPEIRIELTSTSPTTITRETRGSEKGRLKSICFDTPAAVVTKGTLWLEVGVLSGGLTSEYKTAVFFSGSPSRNDKVLWNGDYPFDPADNLYVEAKSLVSIILRISGRLEGDDP